MNVLILGLGNHGGGAGAAEYFCKKGYNVTVTDLRPEEDLQKSLIKLYQLPITYRLGCHNPEDIQRADLVIKNPAVSPDNKLLRNHANVQSDLSYSLPLFDIPIIAITGTKGKSTAAASIAAILDYLGWKTFLMGNIGISPFHVLSETAKLSLEDKKKALIILELSSWQLRDLSRYTNKHTQQTFFSMAVITSLFRDHLNSYLSYEDYISDKMMIFTFLKHDGITIVPDSIKRELASRNIVLKNNSTFTNNIIIDTSGNQFETTEIPLDIIPTTAVCKHLGYSFPDIKTALQNFSGLTHRREVLRVVNGITYINDSAATVPESIIYCVDTLEGEIHLISGGTDKKLDMGTFVSAFNRAASLHLLGGSLTDKLIPMLSKMAITHTGPHLNMESALTAARKCAEKVRKEGVASYVILSPGAASFDIFLNEFERGNIFKELVCIL
jgi:UDP-N-acetylmuramoylalanine--D-glutamate ligase